MLLNLRILRHFYAKIVLIGFDQVLIGLSILAYRYEGLRKENMIAVVKTLKTQVVLVLISFAYQECNTARATCNENCIETGNEGEWPIHRTSHPYYLE